MGFFSNIFNPGKEEQAQPTDGTFNDRYQVCPDCDGVLLCSAHLAEMKTLLEAQDTTEQPPAPQPRRWFW